MRLLPLGTKAYGPTFVSGTCGELEFVTQLFPRFSSILAIEILPSAPKAPPTELSKKDFSTCQCEDLGHSCLGKISRRWDNSL